MNIKFPRDHKDHIIRSIQEYFYRQNGEEIGEIAAEDFMNFALKEIGPFIYNEAIKDAKSIIDDKMMNLEEDLSSLERPIRK
ncbi:DUF2164 domain-containing protein [Bacillus sp. M6-12]|uniref:DUF2164 domain-containing protein n=1 Tax=Bacillus sp. M6-12 TaxID=2054166 RepID=UPI000C780D63|nr:DUF2164 domain-containing protein [Bacillus sp. M6-12]PLS14725.1 DUF2164 domain-containing protein [Bacillus sp. M6-12]